MLLRKQRVEILSISLLAHLKQQTFAETFKTFTGAYSDEETFELTDAAKAKYLGTNGKEVGLYGGPVEFDLTPSYPLISKMTVDEKTDDNGQLKVEIGIK